MNQEGRRRVAGHRLGCCHGCVSFVPMREKGRRDALARTPDRRPAHGLHSPLDGEGRGRDEPAIDRASGYDKGSDVGSIGVFGKPITAQQSGSGS